MKNDCHAVVAESIVEIMKEKYNIHLDKKSFVYGNTKPDHTLSFLYVRHNIQSTFKSVDADIRKLSGYDKNSSDSFENYCFKLGLVCHFVTDYFSFAHNVCFTGGLRKHIAYERTQRKLCPEFIESVKNAVKERPNIEINNVSDLISFLLCKHKFYLADSNKDLTSDFYYAISTCCDLIFTIFNIAYNREFALNNKFA